MQPSAAKERQRLPRRLGLFSAMAVIVGTTIGSGIFRTPAVVAGRLPDSGAFFACWLVGGLLALAGALTFAELSAMFPHSGGVYVFVREAFGRQAAFVFGWTSLLVIRPASYAAIATVCSEYLWRLAGADGTGKLSWMPTTPIQLTAAGLIVLVAGVNYRGIQLGAVIQNVSTVLKVGALLALVAIGLLLAPAAASVTTSAMAPGPWTLTAFGLALVSVLWAYDGFADLAYAAGEVRDPGRNLPRAIIVGSASIVVIYLAVNTVYVRVLAPAVMAGSPLVADDVARALMGAAGGTFVTVAVIISTFGATNGICMTGPRIFYAMAQDRLFFGALAQVHPSYRTPARSIAMMAALAVIYVSVRTFAQLADQFIIGLWPFYVLCVAGLFLLRRKRPDADRPYRTWGYPVVPAMFLLASLYLLVNYLLSEPLLFGINIAVMASGVPVYRVWLRGS